MKYIKQLVRVIALKNLTCRILRLTGIHFGLGEGPMNYLVLLVGLAPGFLIVLDLSREGPIMQCCQLGLYFLFVVSIETFWEKSLKLVSIFKILFLKKNHNFPFASFRRVHSFFFINN